MRFYQRDAIVSTYKTVVPIQNFLELVSSDAEIIRLNALLNIVSVSVTLSFRRYVGRRPPLCRDAKGPYDFLLVPYHWI